MTEIGTARLRLRRPRAGDIPDLVALNTDPAVMRHIGGGAQSPRAAAVWARRRIAVPAARGLGVRIVEGRETGAFLGLAGLVRFGGGTEVELAYRLGRHAWGRGIATEVGVGLIDAGFDRLGLACIVAVAGADNQASLGVLAKLGFRSRGTRRAYGQADCPYFRLARADWRADRRGRA